MVNSKTINGPLSGGPSLFVNACGQTFVEGDDCAEASVTSRDAEYKPALANCVSFAMTDIAVVDDDFNIIVNSDPPAPIINRQTFSDSATAD